MQQNGELSVEEILESIKRVIARDNREGAAVERHRRESEGVILRGPGASFGVTPPASTVNDDDLEEDDLVYDHAAIDEDEILELGEAATELEPEVEDAADDALPVAADDEIEAAVEPEMSADTDLTAAQSASPDELQAASANPEGETPIERMVRESLRPMLREWLDDNLPPIVERIVKSELERIMGRSA